MATQWYENAIFYGLDIRRFQDSNGDGFGDIQGLINRLDYLTDLGVDALWLLPFLDTPLRDNGYDVRDYHRVDPRVGTLDDLSNLVDEAHKRNLRLVMDLVMNHTAIDHPWFEASRRDPGSRYRAYYVWAENIPEKTLGGGPIFPGEEDDVWTYDQRAQAYYYHRFYHFQPGLRIANPAVQEEIFHAIDFWLSMGLDGFRIDAEPIMLEVKGLPETRMEHPHRLFENLHDFALDRKLGTVLLGEANLPLNVMDKFFSGDTEMNMLFNFQIAPHIMLALARQNAKPLKEYLKESLDPPANDQWLNFLRHHDELNLEIMPKEQQEAVFQTYAPDENMKIYGRGIRRRIAPMLAEDGQEMDQARLELAFSFLFATPGTPMVFYGDEIGMGDDLTLPGRNAVRTPMQWNQEKNAGFSKAEQLIAPVIDQGPFRFSEVNVANQQERDDSFLNWMKRLIALRKAFPNIGLCSVQVLQMAKQEDRIVAHSFPPLPEVRDSRPLILFHNLAPETVEATAILPEDQTWKKPPTLRLGRGKIQSNQEQKLSVTLPAYGYLWIEA